MLDGDNSDRPRLVFLEPKATVVAGDRIVTSGSGGVFPPGLPVGVAAAAENNGLIRVEPYAELSRLEIVRIVDYRPDRRPAAERGAAVRARHGRQSRGWPKSGHEPRHVGNESAYALPRSDPRPARRRAAMPPGGPMARALMPRDTSLGDRLVPFLSTLCFVLVSVVPVQIPGFAAVTPSFALMAVFHWTIYRPDLLPLTAVFVLGLLLDLLNGTPYLGVAALTLILARTAVLNGRRYFVNRDLRRAVARLPGGRRGRLCLRAGRSSACSTASVLGTSPFIFEAALTVACYPVGSYILVRLHRAFVRTSAPP